jgi:hypothetical protein
MHGLGRAGGGKKQKTFLLGRLDTKSMRRGKEEEEEEEEIEKIVNPKAFCLSRPSHLSYISIKTIILDLMLVY